MILTASHVAIEEDSSPDAIPRVPIRMHKCAGGIVDTFASFVWEPALVKLNAITSATEAACLVLSVDETVRNPRSEQPGGGGPGGMPMGGRGGMPMMGRGRGRGRGMRR